MKYSKIIGSDQHFQSSVNLQYDLNKEEKVKGYIPTIQSITILKRYLNAVCSDTFNEDNATVLIGPYGRGKSHLLLVLSAIISQGISGISEESYRKLTKKLIKADASLRQHLDILQSKNRPLLPIIINSNHTDMNQAFIVALRDALERCALTDFFPETYFDAALSMIEKWEQDYENALKLFKSELRARKVKLSDFKEELKKCTAHAYQVFCDIYPLVSNGAAFNPLQNTDIVKMYEQVCSALIDQKSFGGVYIIFDEFSKFLESSAAMSNMQNLKLIQDFAEMAVRSNKMHICCITHKEILDYSQSDSFRTVDGRFKKVYFIASSEQSYELVANAVTHKKGFDKYYEDHKDELSGVTTLCSLTGIFKDLSHENYTEIIEKKCFPLHPISVYALIQISELVGQNERTLFTFLSQSEEYSFHAFLETHPADDTVELLTAEWIYDYFASLFRIEVFNPKIHSIWSKTRSAIKKCENEAQIKLIKILAICLMIGNDRFPATEILLKAASAYDDKTFYETIASLASLHIITKRRDGIFAFLTPNGVDIQKSIHDLIEQGAVKVDRAQVLTEAYSTPFILPRQHNARTHMQRYFATAFMEASDFWQYTGDFHELKGTADGLIIYLISDKYDETMGISERLDMLGLDENVIVCVSEAWSNNEVLSEYLAACILEKQSTDTDEHFKEELQVYKYDLFKTIKELADRIYSPSNENTAYYNSAKYLEDIIKPLLLNRELSVICDRVYPKTPIINNEMMNKNHLTAQIYKARAKVIDLILAQPNEIALPEGYGPEVSLMRSAIMVKQLDQKSFSDDQNLNEVLHIISEYITQSEDRPTTFEEVYARLTSSPYGMKKGVIPIYIAYVLRTMQDSVVLSYRDKEIPINGDMLSQIESAPGDYTFYTEKGTSEKERYLNTIIALFAPEEPAHISNKTAYAVSALQAWFRSLSKFARDHAQAYQAVGIAEVSKKIQKMKAQLLQYDINPHAFLFKDIPGYLECEGDYEQAAVKLSAFVSEYNQFIGKIKAYLTTETKAVFNRMIQGSLSSIMHDWYEALPAATREHVFTWEVNAFLHYIKENQTYDDSDAISGLAKCVSMLAIEDWNDNCTTQFFESIRKNIAAVEEFSLDEARGDEEEGGTISLSLDYGGTTYENNITISEISGIALTAQGNIESVFEEYGDAITTQERVAMLLKLLRKELDQL